VKSQSVARVRMGLVNHGLGVAVVNDVRVEVGRETVRCDVARQMIPPQSSGEAVAEVPRSDERYAVLAAADSDRHVVISVGYLDLLSRPADTLDVPLAYDAAEARWRLA
jgi:hypothetical protein